MKTDHDGWESDERRYPTQLYLPVAGYRITGCSFTPISANNESDVKCEIKDSGRRAEFSFSLESGPFYDRWRGWLYGVVVVTEEKVR
jgi:hypothetical protein